MSSDFEHRAVSLHGLPLSSPQDQPWFSEDGTSERLHLPAAMHAQVAAHDHSSFEGQEEVLSARFDALEPPPVDSLRDP